MSKNPEGPGGANAAEALEKQNLIGAGAAITSELRPRSAPDQGDGSQAYPDLPPSLDRRSKTVANAVVVVEPLQIPDATTIHETPLPAAYSAARRALAEACRVDEVKAIRDKSLALKVYAYQSKDAELGTWAAEISRRARRRIGELMAEKRAAGEMAKGSRGRLIGPGRGKRGKNSGVKNTLPFSDEPSLEALGIDKNLAKEARRDAAMPVEKFEAEIAKDRELVTAAIKGGAKSVIKEARTKMNREKRERRDERERELAAKIRALPDAKYGVIVEDLELDFEVWSRETGMDRHAANHYPVAEDAHTAEELHERTKTRFACAARDCVAFTWATVPHLAIAIDLMRLRGFRYVSNYVWGKSQDQPGTGFWSRNKHEHLLIGVRGSIPCPAPGTQWDSLIMAPRGKHSEKPECFLEMIEQYFPNTPKIELNRRGPPRPGWDAWGNEAEAAP